MGFVRSFFFWGERQKSQIFVAPKRLSGISTTTKTTTVCKGRSLISAEWDSRTKMMSSSSGELEERIGPHPGPSYRPQPPPQCCPSHPLCQLQTPSPPNTSSPRVAALRRSPTETTAPIMAASITPRSTAGTPRLVTPREIDELKKKQDLEQWRIQEMVHPQPTCHLKLSANASPAFMFSFSSSHGLSFIGSAGIASSC